MQRVWKVVAVAVISSPLLIAAGCASQDEVNALRRDVDALKADVANASAQAQKAAAAAQSAADKADRIYRRSLRK
ncbi:MAG: hypothetical protein QNJ94_03950 [Alphaproteobacteria bacterium]|nr:hypothetical protein [Alphaproteobacteria bacterium]